MDRVSLDTFIQAIAQENTQENQRRFGSNRGLTDMILVLRLMQLKCTEHNRGLYASFVDILGLKVKEGGGGPKTKTKRPDRDMSVRPNKRTGPGENRRKKRRSKH